MKNIELKKPKGRLMGPMDSRLNPAEPFYGQSDLQYQIQEWLDTPIGSTNVFSAATVKGAPGIGKSRLCQRVIAKYLQDDPKRTAFYISLQSTHSLDGLWARIAEAYEWTDTDVGDFPRRMDEIGGLIYLDNLEDVLDDPKVKAVLQRFAQFGNAKVLSSSREELGLIGKSISLGRLDKENSKNLFAEYWTRVGGPLLTVDAGLEKFIHHQLDCHPLSIKLVASLAGMYPHPQQLISAWNSVQTKLATQGTSKDESLDISITLSYKKLVEINTEAIQAWATVAMFPEGMSVLAQEHIFPKEWATPNSPLNLLVHHNLAERQEYSARITMLAPLQQYILGRFRVDADFLGGGAFLDKVFEYQLILSRPIEQKLRSEDADKRFVIDRMLEEFPALSSFVQVVTSLESEWPEKVGAIYEGIHNLFQFRSLLGHPILQGMIVLFRKAERKGTLANALKSLGDLESRLGNVDSARALYEEAIGHFKTERANRGLANALKSLGDLDRRLGNVDSARALYEEAIGHYKTERDHLGLANALQSHGDLEIRLGNVNSARALYEEAIGHYKTEHANLGLANSLKSLGDLDRRLGNVDSARALYEEAIGHYKTERDHLGLSNALKSLGDLESRLGNVDSARALYEEAIGHYKTERANLGLANAFQSLGDLENRLGNVESARALYEEAIGHYKTERSNLGLANALQSLGDLHRHLGDVEGARSLLEQAILHYGNERANLGLANAIQSLGYLESRLGNIDKARSLFEKSISHYKNERDHLGLANALHSLGDLESRLGNVDSARALYEEAIGHYKTERDHLGLANALKGLGDLDRRLGNVESALALYEEAIGHYKSERHDQGLANVKMSLGLMDMMSGEVQSAFTLLGEAVQLFEKERDPMGLAQCLALIALILHGAEQHETRDQVYVQAVAAAEASHAPGVIAYVQNIGKQWGANP